MWKLLIARKKKLLLGCYGESKKNMDRCSGYLIKQKRNQMVLKSRETKSFPAQSLDFCIFYCHRIISPYEIQVHFVGFYYLLINCNSFYLSLLKAFSDDHLNCTLKFVFGRAGITKKMLVTSTCTLSFSHSV